MLRSIPIVYTFYFFTFYLFIFLFIIFYFFFYLFIFFSHNKIRLTVHYHCVYRVYLCVTGVGKTLTAFCILHLLPLTSVFGFPYIS